MQGAAWCLVPRALTLTRAATFGVNPWTKSTHPAPPHAQIYEHLSAQRLPLRHCNTVILAHFSPKIQAPPAQCRSSTPCCARTTSLTLRCRGCRGGARWSGWGRWSRASQCWTRSLTRRRWRRVVEGGCVLLYSLVFAAYSTCSAGGGGREREKRALGGPDGGPRSCGAGLVWDAPYALGANLHAPHNDGGKFFWCGGRELPPQGRSLSRLCAVWGRAEQSLRMGVGGGYCRERLGSVVVPPGNHAQRAAK